LRPKEENPEDNLNKTYYRDQINKVALLIQEIIQGLQKGDTTPAAGKNQTAEKRPEKATKEKGRSGKNPFLSKWNKQRTLVTAILICLPAAIVLYSMLFKGQRTVDQRASENRITLVVIPFRNMTGDTSWNIWQKGIQDNLITYLSNYSRELEVRQTATINSYIRSRNLSYTSITPSVASVISEDLNADIFVYGSIKMAGNVFRISAQAINTETEEVLKSFQLEGTSGSEMLAVIDSLAVMVSDYLVISVMGRYINPDLRPLISTPSSDAYRFAFYGLYAYFEKRDYPAAANWFKKAADRDTNFVVSLVMLSNAYGEQQKYDEAKSWSLKASSKNNLATFQQKLLISLNNATWFETPREEIRYLNQLLALDDQMPYFNYRLGSGYCKLMQYEEAVPVLEKSLVLYGNQNLKPWWIETYVNLGLAYNKTGQFKKEKGLYKAAEQHFPGDPLLTYRRAVHALSVGDSVIADALIDKYISLRKGNSDRESDILSGVADIFSESGTPHKAEEYYRRALALEPDNHERNLRLASFLIRSDRNIAEGSALADELLDLDPENYKYLELKGRVLLRERRYREALDMMERSWDLRIKNGVYDHEAFLQLEAARKAVAGL
jgi:tetratricopeptide (TPR) repeat protein